MKSFSPKVFFSVPVVLGLSLSLSLPSYADDKEDPFAFLLDDNNTVFSKPQAPSKQTDYKGWVEVGFDFTSDDNFSFGQYNGHYEDDLQPIFSLDYRQWQKDKQTTPSYWDVQLWDVGTPIQQGSISYAQPGSFKLTARYDQQFQAGNSTGRTPFIGAGSSDLTLPQNWVSAGSSLGMSELNSSLLSFEQEKERNKFTLDYQQSLMEGWSLSSTLSSEKKTGQQTMGGAFYIDASNPHAIILVEPINQTTTEFDFAVQYGNDQMNLNASYLFSHFDTQETDLQWQNPYDANYGVDVDYPNGVGQMSLAPDNQMHQFRINGNYLINPRYRIQADGSFGRASQDESFLPYSVNPSLTVNTPAPRQSLDGKVDTTTFDIGLYGRPMNKLSVNLKYHFDDRNNQTSRDGYNYIKGDSADQQDDKYTVYNRPYSTQKNRFDLEGSYRLPYQAKASLGYRFENVSRYNTSVEDTDESTIHAGLRVRPFNNTSAKVSLAFSDRAASTYQWDQSYYALLDSELINETPDSQRYNNHPSLSQYYMSNREKTVAKVNLNFIPDRLWSHNLFLIWDDNHYDKTSLGLEADNRQNMTLSSSYLPSTTLSVTAYYSYDLYNAEQNGRSFRGGVEKNAFVTVAPFPQASDPTRDWYSELDDTTHALGFNIEWQAIPSLVDIEFDYNFVDTEGKQTFNTGGASDLAGTSLPAIESRLHHIKLGSTYYFQKDLSIKLNYQFYRLSEKNWAIDDMSADSVDKVVLTEERSANDNIHFVGLSVLYRIP